MEPRERPRGSRTGKRFAANRKDEEAEAGDKRINEDVRGIIMRQQLEVRVCIVYCRRRERGGNLTYWKTKMEARGRIWWKGEEYGGKRKN